MTPNQLPPLSDEQFPDFLTDTDVARIFRHVYGGQQFDSTERMFSAEVEAAVRAKFREALAAIAQQAQPVHQFRRRLCADWYDGHPDHEDGGGPYETRILYTAQQAQPVDELIEFEASMREKHGWVARDFQSDSFGYFDGHTATAWLAWQARAALQSTTPQTKGQP